MGSSAPPCLRRLRLKPEDCAPTELFAQWRAALGEVFEVRATPPEIAAFLGDIDVHASARYVVSASRNSPLSLVRRSAGAATGGLRSAFSSLVRPRGSRAIGRCGLIPATSCLSTCRSR